MNELEASPSRWQHDSHNRHLALLEVVYAVSELERSGAHLKVYRELTGKNIWVAITQTGILLSREWPDSPYRALVSFPDQATALKVLEEIGANSSFSIGVMSYDDAIVAANSNNAVLVMVVYDKTPHYVPVSSLIKE